MHGAAEAEVLYAMLAILFIYDVSLFVTIAMAPEGKVPRREVEHESAFASACFESGHWMLIHVI